MNPVPLEAEREPAAVAFAGARQVPLALGLEPPVLEFGSFVPAGNEALLQHLQQGGPLRAPVYLWGPRGCGKSHLLQAWLAQCRQRGAQAGVFQARPGEPEDADAHHAGPTQVDAAWQGLVIDDVHRLDPPDQQRLFAWLVEAQGQGVAWLAAGDVPPVDLPLREDLRSRLGWGAVYALQPLADGHARTVLSREAARRGFALGEEVADYLLHRFSRDLPSLMRLLDTLDGYALARKRAVTVPLLREMLAEANS